MAIKETKPAGLIAYVGHLYIDRLIDATIASWEERGPGNHRYGSL